MGSQIVAGQKSWTEESNLIAYSEKFEGFDYWSYVAFREACLSKDMWDEEERGEFGVPQESQLEGYTGLELESGHAGGTGEEGMNTTDISEKKEQNLQRVARWGLKERGDSNWGFELGERRWGSTGKDKDAEKLSHWEEWRRVLSE